MKQKTAIDWLIEQLMSNKFGPEIIEQARTKFREQIEEGFNKGRSMETLYHEMSAKRYYQITYENER